MTKNIFQNIAIAGLGLILTAGFSSPITQAQEIDISGLDFVSTQDIGVYPCESEFIEGISQSRSWILKNSKAGDTIETCVLVANPTDETKTIKIGAQSAIPTSDGAISMTSDGQELTDLGSWIDLGSLEETIEVTPGNGREINFNIEIPNDTEAGEYAGAISVMEISEEEETGNFNILRRYGSRIYVSVEPQSEFKIGTEFDTFEFIVPGSQLYDSYTKNARAYKWDSITMTWKFNTAGNIFAKQKGELVITNPDGETWTNSFSGDYFPESEVFTPYISTDGIFTKPGTYKARFEFEHEATIPWNKDAEAFEDVSSVNFVETEIEVTQEMLDQLKADKNTLDTLLTEEEKVEKEAAETAGFKGFSEEESLPQTGGAEESSDNTVMIVASVSGIIILTLIGAITFILLKKKKGEKEAK